MERKGGRGRGVRGRSEDKYNRSGVAVTKTRITTMTPTPRTTTTTATPATTTPTTTQYVRNASDLAQRRQNV